MLELKYRWRCVGWETNKHDFGGPVLAIAAVLRNIYSLPTSKDAFLDLWRSKGTSVINNPTTIKLFFVQILPSNGTAQTL